MRTKLLKQTDNSNEAHGVLTMGLLVAALATGGCSTPTPAQGGFPRPGQDGGTMGFPNGFTLRLPPRSPIHDELMRQVRAGDLEGVVRSLDRGAPPNEIYATEGDGALHVAAEKGDCGIARALLSRGADINLRAGFSGKTPLMRAAYEGRHEMVELLVQGGAKVNARAVSGCTALHAAVERVELASRPVRGTALLRPPLPVIEEEQLAIIRCLVEHGAKPLARPRGGTSPLGLARAYREIYGANKIAAYFESFADRKSRAGRLSGQPGRR